MTTNRQVRLAPRSDADLVVTEHGIAALRGLDLSHRVQRMIASAASELREDLARELLGLRAVRTHGGFACANDTLWWPTPPTSAHEHPVEAP